MRGAPHSQSPTSALSQYSLCFTSSALGGSAFGAGGVPAPLNHLGGGGGCSGLRTLGPSLEGPLPSPPAISHDFFFSFLAPLSLPFPLAPCFTVPTDFDLDHTRYHQIPGYLTGRILPRYTYLTLLTHSEGHPGSPPQSQAAFLAAPHQAPSSPSSPSARDSS